MLDSAPKHSTELEHHVRQGLAWLASSADGENTAALSYAALELRFAVERLGVHYWLALLDRIPEEADFKTLESFKRIEQRIYELGGHQRHIDLHFAFMRVVLKALKLDADFLTRDVGLLSKYWHQCSAMCHIAWPLSSGDIDVKTQAFLTLTEIAEALAIQVRSLGWPILRDVAFAALRNDFLTGKASEADVQSHIRSRGLWARNEFDDGRPSQFVGEAIPPDMASDISERGRG
jgi:hypothetical protein